MWLLARFARILRQLGGTICANERIVDRQWTLKYTKDSVPALTCDLAGIQLELYYQLFQVNVANNNMPDIALKVRDQGFVVVADPKHGRTYSRAELVSVCQRYDSAFEPDLTCVMNYFGEPGVIEYLPGQRKKMLLWGLQPDSAVEQQFDAETVLALRSAWARFALPKPMVIALFDISASTQSKRDVLQRHLSHAIDALFPGVSLDSQIALFGATIVAEASLLSAMAGVLDFSKSDDSTDLDAALTWAAAKLAQCQAGQRQLWLFTDDAAHCSLDLNVDQIRTLGARLVVYELSVCTDATLLQKLCMLAGGAHHFVGNLSSN